MPARPAGGDFHGIVLNFPTKKSVLIRLIRVQERPTGKPDGSFISGFLPFTE